VQNDKITFICDRFIKGFACYHKICITLVVKADCDCKTRLVAGESTCA